MAGTIVVDRLESDASYASSINIASPVIVSNTFAFPAGSASAPAISPTGDTNTGIFFPAADTIAFAEGGTEVMRIDSDGDVGIGTNNPFSKLHIVSAAGTQQVRWSDATNGTAYLDTASGVSRIWTNVGLAFGAGAESFSERMRITSGGALCVGTTSATGTVRFAVESDTTTTNPMSVSNTRAGAATDYSIIFYRAGNIVGSVQTSLSATSYVTSSDYRLKENIAPMTGALAKVAQLKPVTYDWKAGGSSQGFIAHELQAVVPDCVTGEKDAVETYLDEDNNEQTRIKPQGVDTSFLVATLTAAIQELNAKVELQAAEIALLKSK